MQPGRAHAAWHWLVPVLIAGCVAAPTPEPAPDFRRAGAPIGSVLDLDTERLSGRWVQVAHFPSGCAGAQMQVVVEDDGLVLDTLCDGALRQTRLHPDGAGRFAAPDGAVWVLWVDHGYRTLVLGAPDGRFGAVWNRDAQIPADRRAAARELLDFNGYDLSLLREDSQ